MTGVVPGQVVGAYRVVRLLGSGGMAEVYEAEHLELGIRYALKVFALEQGRVELFRKRFSVEGKILARLHHARLVRVVDLGVDESARVLYYAMDLVLSEDGTPRTLADVEPGSVDESRLREWFSQLCEALAYVHGRGVVHRDIKLGNILLASDGGVVLSDFGVSRVIDEDLRRAVSVEKTIVTGEGDARALVMGTQGYMAPELLQGREATPAADVYSLGVTFFKLLTNVWYDPCLAPQADKGSSIGINSTKLLAFFDYSWDEALPRMLEEDPDRRPVDLMEVAASVKFRQRHPECSRRSFLRRIVVVVTVLIAVGLGALLFRYLSRPGSGQPDDRAREFDEVFSSEGLK